MHVWSEELGKGSDHYSSAKSAAHSSAPLGVVQLTHELRCKSAYPTNALGVLVKSYKMIKITAIKYNYIYLLSIFGYILTHLCL